MLPCENSHPDGCPERAHKAMVLKDSIEGDNMFPGNKYMKRSADGSCTFSFKTCLDAAQIKSYFGRKSSTVNK